MKAARSYIKDVIADPLFVRVCMVVWGAPFIVLGVVAVPQVHPTGAGGWFALSILTAFGCYGAYLVSVALFGGARLVERSTGAMSEGGEVVGLVFALAVAVLAVPITVVIRAMRRNREA